ncbi:MAG: DUF1850 domain-containing protein [Spirochaetaceae bacterium]|nr:DUF1850 domain-containing protein [Spirochaetaceae bacterium]
MMGRSGERAVAATAFAVALLFAASCATSRVAELVVSAKDGRELAVLRLVDGKFEHRFIHSYHLTPVRERFEVATGEKPGIAPMHLYELRYQSSGVGMPEDAEGGYRLEDGVFVLAMDRSFDRVPVFVSIVPGHGIEVGGIFHPFAEWAEPMQLVVLSSRTRFVSRSGGICP